MAKRKHKHLQFTADPRDLVVLKEPKTPVSEQYRTIRTNITYSSIDSEIKSVLFTSALPGAGKSTTAANVANAFAQAGNSTVLMYVDMSLIMSHYTLDDQ